MFAVQFAAVFLFICGGVDGAAVRIGAIVDVGCRAGREEKTAIEIAINDKSLGLTHSSNISNKKDYIIVISNTVTALPARLSYATSRNNTVQPLRGHGSGGGGGGGGHVGGGGGGGGIGGGGGGHYYHGGGPSGGSWGGGRVPGTAGTWMGRCSNDQRRLPTSNAKAAQRLVLKAVGDARFVWAANVGCYSQAVTLADGSKLIVYSTFSCALQTADKCSACFNDAVKHIQHRCTGSAGAIYSGGGGCCLRYELYYFCGAPDECSV
ncbi:hypothetical protein LINGRAHAP2_LOCUS26687 [Linum grandiflorum]